MSTIWDISDKEFIKIIKESQFYKDVARKCGYN